MTMKFGKFRGRPLADLDDDYLSWLRTLALREPLRTGVEAEWRRRFNVQASPGLPAELREIARRLVNTGYRALAREAHPDAGGTTQAMQQLNSAVEALRRVVEGT